MKISVISPSFNQARYLGLMLSSVSKQDCNNYEHIILDPGSIDGSVDLLRAYSDGNTHARLVLEPDRGQADAINKGFAISNGDILTWLNSDDYYIDGEVFSTVIDYFTHHPDVDIAYGRGIRVDDRGGPIREAFVHPHGTDFATTLEHSIGLLQPALFFRRHVYEKAGGPDEAWPLQLDYELWIRYAQAGFKFGFINRLICKATVHDEAKSTQSRQRQLNECLALVSSRFGFAASDWISRHAEFFLTRRDAKTDSDISLDRDQALLKSCIERDLHRYFNSPAIIQGRLLPTSPARERTLARMKDLRVSPPVPARIVVTSFDSHYFQQGLNLIASLHRTSIDSIDRIVVYPLGLNENERGRLSDLEKVELVDYPDNIRQLTFPEFLDPKTRAYKAYATRPVYPHNADGDLVLWMDAGLSALQDIDAVFTLIDSHDFFITDHDDSRHWPFYNVSFMHSETRKIVKPTNRELMAKHLCSAMVGYRVGGRHQKLIDQAWEYGRLREAVLWPKNITPGEMTGKVPGRDELKLREEFSSGRLDPDDIPMERLLSAFGYHGHRTQSILSVLASRYNAPVFPGSIYRQSNDSSSKAARRNWQSSARETDRIAGRGRMDGVSAKTVVYHHRGIYNHLDGLKFRNNSADLFILGNGPSLRGFDFSRLISCETLGMNAAYRFWETTGFYPSYYACFDTVVQESHQSEIRRLIRESGKNGIRKFFLRETILHEYPELADDPSVFILEHLQRTVGWFAHDKVTTGSFSVMVGLLLGYRTIYLLGIDLNYVEKLPEARVDGRALEMADTPTSNPNYFFDGYQLKGDRYNPPNRHPEMHLRSWRQLKEFLGSFPATIINLNSDSAVRDFPFDCFDNALKNIFERYRAAEVIAGSSVQKSRERAFWRQELLALLDSSRTQSQDAAHGGRLVGVRVFDRSANARLDETELVSCLYSPPQGIQGVMIDVGAHHGGSARWFLDKGWNVYCFEPDSSNRELLGAQLGKRDGLYIDRRAVAAESLSNQPFYRSNESTGISSLHAFHDSHSLAGEVDVTTVTEIADQYGINRIDFLKIDVEGFDLDVLNGVPWERIKPAVIECEFEDAKTLALGHGWREIADFLVDKGYKVYVSEWHPVVQYGLRHQWRAMKVYPCELEEEAAWGNLLAFHTDPGLTVFESSISHCLSYAGKSTRGKGRKKGRNSAFLPWVNQLSDRLGQKIYDSVARKIRHSGSPNLYRLGKFAVWLWPRLKWHAGLIASFTAAAAAFLLIGQIPGMSEWKMTMVGLSVATMTLGFTAIAVFGLRGWLRRREVSKALADPK
jgi:FkbM family methyltransferase